MWPNQSKDRIKALLPEVRECLIDSVPEYWPELKTIVQHHFAGALPPEALLPLAACEAAGGDPKTAIPVAAALLASAAAVRIFDDLADRDRPEALPNRIGAGRALNAAAAIEILPFRILEKSQLKHEVVAPIRELFIDTYLILAAGQDIDLRGHNVDPDLYWKTMEWKSGGAYASACLSGAYAGTGDSEILQGLNEYGHHLGMTIQIMNDFDSIWNPEGITDLEQGKITLPLIYGIKHEHPDQDKLLRWIREGKVKENAKEIKIILEGIGTREYLIWAAFQERGIALENLEKCSENQGKAILQNWVTGIFGDINDLIPEEKPDPSIFK